MINFLITFSIGGLFGLFIACALVAGREYKNDKFYKSRNEKAIEFILENCIDDEFYINLTNKEKNIIKALDILRGDDNE